MHNAELPVREPACRTVGSRFFIIILSVVTFAGAQTDTANTAAISAGTEYVDLFRQRSNRSNTTFLSRASFIGYGMRLGADSLSVSYRGYSHYASFNQNESKTNFSLTQQRHAADVGFNGSISIFRYSIIGGSTIYSARNSFRYGAGIGVRPWNDLIELSAELHRTPSRFGSMVLFQDYLVNFDERPMSTEWRFALGGKPHHDVTAAISFSTLKGTTTAPAAGYGTTTAHITQSADASIGYSIDAKTNFILRCSSTETGTDVTLKQDDVSFGSLSDGSQTYDHIEVTANSDLLPFSFTIGYMFDEIRFTGAGRVESWPFTSFAASVISNRLLFRTSGSIKHHAVSLTTPFTFASVRLLAGLSYHRILPDVVLEHWEPEFLVFGMKNFVRDPFSIRDAHLGKASISVEFPLMSSLLNLFIEQYLPISITYRSHRSVQPAPSPEPSPSTPIETDGGRRFGIQICVMF